MRVGIDARAYGWAGIGRCIRNLLTELSQNPASKKHHFIIITGKESYKEIASKYNFDNWTVKVVEESYYSFKEQTILLRQLNMIKADIWHFMHFNIPIFFNKPYIVTIHDTTRFIFPGQKRQSLWQQVAYEYVFKRAVERAKTIVCISETTKKELLNLPLNINTSNIKLISWGLEKKFLKPVGFSNRQKVRMLLDTNEKYLLFVGVWMNHKNLPRLMRAFKTVLQKHPRLKLVLTGKPKPGYNNMVEIARNLDLLDNLIFPGFVTDKLLPALYAEAACLVFPSLYEGFGFPALEAVAIGTPVVTSNISCMPEVMGDVAEYVNPEYVPSIASGILKVLDDNYDQQRIKQLGPKWAGQYKWRDIAQEYLDVYEKSLS